MPTADPIPVRWDVTDQSGATEQYLSVLRASFEDAGFSPCDRGMPTKQTLIFTDRVERAFRHLLHGKMRHAIWIQGAWPEESFERNHSRLRYLFLSAMERAVLRRAEFVFLCSDAMREHLEKKHHLSFSGRSFVMPCYRESSLCPQAFAEEDRGATFAYVGSLAEWQCFPQTAALFRQIENARPDAFFSVFTEKTEQASALLREAGVERFEVKCLYDDALHEVLSHVRYGFLLREEHIINRVATPTKLSTYLSCGVTPIYSPVFADFAAHVGSLGITLPLPRNDASRKRAVEQILRDLDTPREKSQRTEYESVFASYYHENTYKSEISRTLRRRFGAPDPQKKRILFLINRMDRGGIPQALCSLLRALGDSYTIDLLALRDGALTRDVPPSVRLLPVPPMLRATELSFAERRKLPFGARLFRLFSAVFVKYFGKGIPFSFVCRKKARRYRGYDAVISFCQPLGDRVYGNIAPELALAIDAKKHILFLHSDFPAYGGNTRRNRALLRQFDEICAVSDGVAARLCEAMPGLSSLISVVPNLTEPARIRALADAAPEPKSNIPTAISVCRLSPEKGLSRVLPHLAKLKSEQVAFRWLIVGDGSEKGSLLRDLRAYDLCDRVFLLGERENPYGLMASADFLLVPSVHEAAPLVIDEVLALGLPVLTTETCSAREQVGCHGLVVPQTDEALADGLSRFLRSREYASYPAETPDFETKKRNTLDAFAHAVAPKKKVPASPHPIRPLLPTCVLLSLLLILRDAARLPIGKVPILLLVALSLIPMDRAETRLYLVFLLPLSGGLPANYITVFLIVKLLSLLLDRRANDRVPIALSLTGAASAVFVLLQSLPASGLARSPITFGAELILLLLLVSAETDVPARSLARAYSLSVLLFGALALAVSAETNSLTSLLTGAVRFGDLYVPYDSIRSQTDPNFLGFFCLTGITAYAELRRTRRCGRAEAAIMIAALGFFGIIGLSRSFLICAAVLLLCEGILCARTPRGLAKFVAGTVFFGAAMGALLHFALPELTKVFLLRFSKADLANANGRFALIAEWASAWFDSAKTLLFGCGLFTVNVHTTLLQIVFGLGLVGGTVYLAFTALFARRARLTLRDPKTWISVFVPLLMSATIPAARALFAYFPLIFAVLFGAALIRKEGDRP